jgi:hypothetical protein
MGGRVVEIKAFGKNPERGDSIGKLGFRGSGILRTKGSMRFGIRKPEITKDLGL